MKRYKALSRLPTLAIIAFLIGMPGSNAYSDYEDFIDPRDAFDWASSNEYVYILDVRTGDEWRWAGHPGPNALAEHRGKGLAYENGAMLADKVVNIAWYIPSAADTSVWYPNGADFAQFIMDVKNEFPLIQLTDNSYYSDYILLLLCRTGGRAKAAAERLGALGYSTYTIEWGFQGPANDETYPGPDTGYQDVYGWINAKLPYNGNKGGGDYRTYEPEP